MPMRLLLLPLLALLLTACGGSDFPPVVQAIRVDSLKYHQTATIAIGGKDLRSSLVADTGGRCTEPRYAANSTTDVLVLNCKVTTVGELPLTLRTADGQVLYATTLTVPLPQVALVTTEGSIVLELDPVAAPVTTRNFLDYVNLGFYNSTLFHRVIPGVVAQGGGYTTGLVAKAGKFQPIVLETPNGLSNLRGTVAMARTSVPDSATSEFYFNLVDNAASLDWQGPSSPGYAVFGKVIQGLAVVDTIATRPTGTLNGFQDVPLSDITLNVALQLK